MVKVMKHSFKNMRKQIIDFANSVVTPKDNGCVRGKRLTDKESRMMMFRECMQTEDKIDKAVKKLLDGEYFKEMMQLNDEREL